MTFSELCLSLVRNAAGAFQYCHWSDSNPWREYFHTNLTREHVIWAQMIQNLALCFLENSPTTVWTAGRQYGWQMLLNGAQTNMIHSCCSKVIFYLPPPPNEAFKSLSSASCETHTCIFLQWVKLHGSPMHCGFNPSTVYALCNRLLSQLGTTHQSRCDPLNELVPLLIIRKIKAISR